MPTEHLLHNCILQIGPKTGVWPQEIPLQEKLHGDLVALSRTAEFAWATEANEKEAWLRNHPELVVIIKQVSGLFGKS